MLEDDRHFIHELREYPGTFAFLSPSDDSKIAVVFVHGFGGDPYGTWSDFHHLVDELDPDKWRGSDLFFYSYESLSRQIPLNVLRFLSFLGSIYPLPSESVFQINARDIGLASDATLSLFDSDRTYEKLVLVAHSEGGLVVRRAILQALEVMTKVKGRAASRSSSHQSAPENDLPQGTAPSEAPDMLLLQARVCLFAPAICGYRPAGLKSAILSFPLVGNILTSILNISPAYQDMRPQELTDLRREVEEAANAHPELNGLRARVVWGDDEKLLKACWFSCDDPLAVPGKNHVSVCKPTREYPLPLDVVVG